MLAFIVGCLRREASIAIAEDQATRHFRTHTALAKWKTLRRVVRDVADVCAETTDDDVDVAHLAGVFTDREAGVAGPDPVPFGAA